MVKLSMKIIWYPRFGAEVQISLNLGRCFKQKGRVVELVDTLVLGTSAL